MIYSILKILCRITIRSYFRRYKVDGKENIPPSGPYIFVANHPSAFMDPIIVASIVKPQVYFIAAGEYMGKGFKSWFLQKVFHMIPVYRPNTRPGETHKNADMFKNCFKHLGKKRSLLIFPEGVSITERKLKPLKTGVSRIARGAEITYGMSLDLHVVPVGLNYSNPHQFRSDLYVKIGEPIRAIDFIQNPDAETEEVRKMTDVIELEMKKTVLHLESDEEESLMRKVEKVYSSQLRREFDIDFEDQKREFKMQQDLIHAIDYFKANQKGKVDELSVELDEYFSSLREYGLAHRGLNKQTKAYGTGLKLSFVLGAPIFLLGFVLNAIPYFIIQMVNKRLKVELTFQGSFILASGLFIYLLWYLGISIGTSFIPHVKWWSLCVAPVAYVSGIYALVYSAAYQRFRDRKEAKRYSKKDEEGVQGLKESRDNIIAKLESFKYEYLELFGGEN